MDKKGRIHRLFLLDHFEINVVSHFSPVFEMFVIFLLILLLTWTANMALESVASLLSMKNKTMIELADCSREFLLRGRKAHYGGPG